MFSCGTVPLALLIPENSNNMTLYVKSSLCYHLGSADCIQVLTSYAVLESCFRKQQSGFKRKGHIVKEPSPLHQIRWNRIIVSFARDESHH